MKKQIDGPVAKLVKDLEESGHLDRTLIILASEFSRYMLMEGRPGATVKNPVKPPAIINEEKFYGMHRHFTDGCSVLMFGGGVKKECVYGKTSDERPCKTLANPNKNKQLPTTLYQT